MIVMSYRSQGLLGQSFPFQPNGNIVHVLSDSPTLIAQVPVQQPEPYQERRSNSSEIMMMGMGLVLVLGMIFILFRKKRSPQTMVESVYTPPEHERVSSSSIPCRHCHYFHPNLHLQCAVHPDTVLKRQAAQCTDYRNRNNQDKNMAA